MASKELIDYIQTEEAKGFTTQQLRDVLLNRGYTPQQVDEALDEAHKKKVTTPSQQVEHKILKQTNFTYRRESGVFLLSLFTLGLYNFYWHIKITKNLKRITTMTPSSFWLILFPVPLVTLIYLLGTLQDTYILLLLAPTAYLFIQGLYYWHFAKAVNNATNFSQITIFSLLFIFPAAGIALCQEQLNITKVNR